MSKPVDPRQPAIEHAIKMAATSLLAREIGIGEALAAVATVMGGGTKDDETSTPRELAAVGRQAHRAQIVGEIVRYEKEGRGLAKAALSLARVRSPDQRGPIRNETLKNKVRRG